ncbi:MAG: ferrous iron transport protein A [Oscillatoriophycideae cyanobacterium NC_groundwater_1537_Pr4_S-0.65um_50_18]|nr:ferrous iron transport protein A [Oscillatoriophycideae cyanobacterium NC_groundwater_1537_Pr4_S-0.65um_50_18]
MSTTRLSSLKPGQSAQITALNVEPGVERRLYALGFRCGQEIHLLRQGWMAGPLHVRICMTEVMLRRCDADQIHVAAVSE